MDVTMDDVANTYGDDDDFRSAKLVTPPDKHLDSPITVSLLHRVQEVLKACNPSKPGIRPYYTGLAMSSFERWCGESKLNAYSGLKYTMKPLIDYLIKQSGSLRIIRPQEYPDLFLRESKDKLELFSDKETAELLYQMELKSYSSWVNNITDKKEIYEKLNVKSKLLPECVDYYKRYRYWDKLVEQYRLSKVNNKYGKSSIFNMHQEEFSFYDGFILEKRDKNSKNYTFHMYSYEQLMMIQDAMLARFNVYLGLSIHFHNGTDALKILITKMLVWQESCLRAYSNAGYNLVKGPESVLKTWLTTLSEGDILKYSSFNRTMDKLEDKEHDLNEHKRTPLCNSLRNLVKTVTSIDDAVELFGLTKLSGHPFVLAEQSAASVRKEAQGPGRICPVAVSEYPLYLMRMILLTYIKKHGDWPKFKNPPKEGSKLYKLWKSKNLSVQENSFPILDLEFVKFAKWMDFDYSPEYLEFLDDKAISPGVREASNFWFGGNSNSPRRLLEKLLKTEDIDTVGIVNRMSKGIFKREERIVELTMKEREFKISARCFAKMVFDVRLFFVLTEVNLKNFMGGTTGTDGYLPQQTMTMSESATKKRMYELTKETGEKKSVCLEIDFARWNLKWRDTTVNPIARIIEDIYGFPGVFSQTHRFFKNSTIILTDKHSLPKTARRDKPVDQWEECELLWRNHEGGFEGISQSLWTICTIAMMHWALEGMDVSFIMAGQGDNHIFTLKFQSSDNLEESLSELLVHIEMRCARLNHEVKPEECIDSATVLTYSKEIYVSGVNKQYVLKFASRAFTREDRTVPSLLKEIAGVNSNAMACSSNAHITIRGVYWKFLQVIMLIRRRINSSFHVSERKYLRMLLTREYCQSLLIPASLGGLPMIPWSRFLIRGESDPLTWDVAGVMFLAKRSPKLKNFFSRVLLGAYKEDTIDPTVLIANPHSIPISKLDDDSNIVSREISRVIPNKNRNLDIKSIISPLNESSGNVYKDWLLKMKPLLPEIASDIFKITPAGMREKMIGRFSVTRTVTKIMGTARYTNHINQHTTYLLEQLTSRWKNVPNTPSNLPTSIFDTVQSLRDQWKIGLDNTTIGTYVPLEFDLKPLDPKLSMITAEVYASKVEDILLSVGKAPPNFGTQTKTKLSKHGYAIANTGSTIRDIKRAVLITSELGASSDAKELSNSIIHARSPWDVEQLMGIFPTEFGGSGIHRHKDLQKKSYGIMGSSTVPTHLAYSTDQSGILSGGEDDYPIVFQEFFLVLNHIAQLASATKSKLPLSFGFVIPDKLKPIPALSIQCPPPKYKPRWPSFIGNKLAYISKISFYEIPSVPSSQLVNKCAINDPELTPKGRLLAFLWGFSMLKHPGLLPDENTIPSTDLFDIKEYSRLNPYDVEEIFLYFSLMKSIQRVQAYGGDETISKSIYLLEFSSTLKRYLSFFSIASIRLLMHPKFKDGEYVQNNNLTISPGRSGHLQSARRLCSIWLSDLKNLIKRKHFILTPPQIILTTEWATDITSYLTSFIAASLLTNPGQPLTIKRACELSSKLCGNLSPLIANKNALLHSAIAGIENLTQSINQEPLSLRNTVYVPSTYTEILRPLRELPSLSTKKRKKKAFVLPPIDLKSKGRVLWTSNTYSGRDSFPNDDVSICDQETIINHSRRSLGKSVSVLSDWSAYINLYKPEIDNMDNIALFGVGRGATATAFSLYGAQLYGYDLRESHPVIPHRSTSYIPPELSLYDNKFQWSKTYLQTNGDLNTNPWFFEDHKISVAVVDIDRPLEELIPILEKIPYQIKVHVRFRASLNQLKWLISATEPSTVCRVSFNYENYSGWYIMSYLSKGVSFLGNSQNINLRNDKHFKVLDYHLSTCDTTYQIWDLFSGLFTQYSIPFNENWDIFKTNILTMLPKDNNYYAYLLSFLQNSSQKNLKLTDLSYYPNNYKKFIGKVFSLELKFRESRYRETYESITEMIQPDNKQMD